MIFFGKPDVAPAPPWWPDAPLKDTQPTKGRPIDRVAFSYGHIEPIFERMQAAGATILERITDRPEFKFKSFLVEGPEQSHRRDRRSQANPRRGVGLNRSSMGF